jgi:hypothetical protein
VTPAEREACHQTPAAWTPSRGLEFGTEVWSGELWLAGLVVALAFMTVTFWAAHMAGRRHRAADASGASNNL